MGRHNECSRHEYQQLLQGKQGPQQLQNRLRKRLHHQLTRFHELILGLLDRLRQGQTRIFLKLLPRERPTQRKELHLPRILHQIARLV